jgi:hypothetical protein
VTPATYPGWIHEPDDEMRPTVGPDTPSGVSGVNGQDDDLEAIP